MVVTYSLRVAILLIHTEAAIFLLQSKEQREADGQMFITSVQILIQLPGIHIHRYRIQVIRFSFHQIDWVDLDWRTFIIPLKTLKVIGRKQRTSDLLLILATTK